MTLSYEDFIKNKKIKTYKQGIHVDDINDKLFDWQKSVVKWALEKGTACLFEDCGLGKTAQQLEWADKIHKHTQRPVLIVAPLTVSYQTEKEGLKFGVKVNICRKASDVVNGVNITNYEQLQSFEGIDFSGVVLDESSILKAYMGKTKRLIIDMFANTKYKLACSATPAPNDLMELLNHAEFMGIMKSSEALAIWFMADQTQSGKYRLKGHAENDFWEWVASWAVCIEKPSDIGFSDKGYILPGLNVFDVPVEVNEMSEDFTKGLWRDIDLSVKGFFAEKRITAEDRVKKTREIVMKDNEQYLVWCYMNEESEMLKKSIPEAVEIKGSDIPDKKEKAAIDFIEGRIRVLVSKPSIFGFGLNFQNCKNCVFCGLDFSFESYYQAVRRLYRFGQKENVNIYRIFGTTEKDIIDVIDKKNKQKQRMSRRMSEAMKAAQTKNINNKYFDVKYDTVAIHVPEWLKTEECDCFGIYSN